jgi:hypothetical protein
MPSIYDENPFNPQSAPEPKPPVVADAFPTGPKVPEGMPWQPQTAPPKKKGGCGCVGCMLGCLGTAIVLTVVVGAVGWWAFKQVPIWFRSAVDTAVQESDLSDDDKQVVMQQVDRLIEGYQQGKVTTEKAVAFMEEFLDSPLFNLMFAYATKVKLIDPSGLTPDEKRTADRILQRTMRGVIEKKISKDDLNGALDEISDPLEGGGRQFRDPLSDDEIRSFLEECKSIADSAQIPNEDYQADVGGELKKLVDQALGEVAETPLPEAP